MTSSRVRSGRSVRISSTVSLSATTLTTVATGIRTYHQRYLQKEPWGYCPDHGTVASCPIALGVPAERAAEPVSADGAEA